LQGARERAELSFIKAREGHHMAFVNWQVVTGEDLESNLK
ncbi:MAG: hypothetical protein KDD59_09380, partial [Bdellovibrionales bacterium]|nr:hypothetical protein [Bdellovibrionales bacterium]